jgi:hypothetical protein
MHPELPQPIATHLDAVSGHIHGISQRRLNGALDLNAA